MLGTGDLSELALGWATYGVGDHMSHYNVNASVPKTLIQHLIRWVIDTGQFDASRRARCCSRSSTPRSRPSWCPGDGDRASPRRARESKIGPYELQDFNLYYTLRFGFRPSKVAFLAQHAWGDRERGAWPDLIPGERRNEYDLADDQAAGSRSSSTASSSFSQFKRSAIPNAPKVGSGGSLSPRGDWRAPSDAEAKVWLDELRRNVP